MRVPTILTILNLINYKLKTKEELTDVYKMIVSDKVFETAKKLLKKDISVEDIADSTEFDIDTIESLKDQLLYRLNTGAIA